MPPTASERSEIGRIGAAARLAREDPREMTAAAREGLWRKFYDQTDPGLPEPERERRARALRDEHMARMRLAAQKAARKRREAAAEEKSARAELAALDDRRAG